MTTLLQLLGLTVPSHLPNKFFREAVTVYAPKQKRGAKQWLLMGLGGTLAAATLMLPFVGPAVLGVGAAGAAGFTSFLATLGFGTVAAGGAGMLGGVLLITISGMTGAALLSQGMQNLLMLGVEGMRLELCKLETTERMSWYAGLDHKKQLLRTRQSLRTLLAEFSNKLAQERQISDPESKPIRDLEEIVRLIELALRECPKWYQNGTTA
ncbi:hypothetical protein E7T06_18735 [Deinococcus sp. Arct2-2]|uniref:hypothetical protein n=1 Tax=Deinococcus sp. Arct2-2 TaxID=2568653 RepID=UPI0010A3A449|nr:hypothetical protein [Deinococcus sp. Arct2-2]THF67912.1 hypothetical protein E7T06_18735 [Deinococcus sp. Arct2-2]